jgi:Zn-dependent peptidase ImmA (M78 family)/transcriptional regulator with XRE-family HTH domain
MIGFWLRSGKNSRKVFMESRNPIASAVRSAREALGLTQQGLATAAGFASLQIVSAIETGQREVKAWELVRLARALHTSVDRLLGLDEPLTAWVLWRRGSGGISAAREAQLRERAERFALLEQFCELPVAEPLPDFAFDPQRASFADAERLACSVARTLDLGSRPAASLLPVLEERFRVKLFYDELGPGESAACSRGPFGAAVLLNAAQAPWRRNFSVAHELFHLVTWSAVESRWPEDTEPEWSERLEMLADVFAAQLLLPSDEVNAQFDARTADGRELAGTDVVELAREFGVSTEALAWRLVNLRRREAEWARALLADPDFRRRDRMTMPSRWTRPDIPFPERYRRLALLAYETDELSLSKLAVFLEMSMGEANAMLEKAEHGQEAAPAAP